MDGPVLRPLCCILGHSVVRLLDCRAQIRHFFSRLRHWEVGVVFLMSLLVVRYLDGVVLQLVDRLVLWRLLQHLVVRCVVLLVVVTVLRYHA